MSFNSHKGYIQWQGSESQRLLKNDIQNGLHETQTPLDLWMSRAEYHDIFPLKVFRDKICQEL